MTASIEKSRIEDLKQRLIEYEEKRQKSRAYQKKWRQERREQDVSEGIMETTIRAHETVIPLLRKYARDDLERRKREST